MCNWEKYRTVAVPYKNEPLLTLKSLQTNFKLKGQYKFIS